MTVTGVTRVSNGTKPRRRLLAGGALASALLLGGIDAASPAAALPALPALPAVPDLGIPRLIEDSGSNGSGGGGTGPVIPQPGAGSNYLVGARPDYYDNLKRMVNSLGDPTAKGLVQALESVPVAQWIGGAPGLTNLTNAINLAAPQSAVPVIVVYDIPNRDIGGGHSGGGTTAANYRTWIDGVSQRIGTSKVVLILEPDALPDLSKLNAGQRDERLELMAYATKKLATNANARTYIDVGHPDYGGTVAMGDALKQIAAKGGTVQGVSANVSNFYSTAASTTYAKAVATAFGQPGVKVMIDTSRNGAADKPSGWCNPPGQRLGSLVDKTFDPNAEVEEMFIKTPGDSDGLCGMDFVKNTPAGSFNDQLLLYQLGLEALNNAARRPAGAPQR